MWDIKGYKKYFGKKILWFIGTLVVAVVLNFALPRMMPGDPIALMMSKVARGVTNAQSAQAMYDRFQHDYGLDKPIVEQFFVYCGNLLHGNLGVSFNQPSREVSDIIKDALPWTLALQLPAIVVGWLIGNLLGAIAAYIRKGFDKVLMPVFLFISGIPAFGMAIILLTIFGINLKIAPTGGSYGFDLLPTLSWTFVKSVISHYWLPFWSIVLIAIGGQAIGMRSMSIYELNADYVKYSRFMGIKDSKIVRYVFRNAMLPQITGLALSLGTMVGGALVAEIVFAYRGLGNTLLTAINVGDYPIISAITLIITIMVLVASFVIDIIYGLLDPRVKAAQIE